MQTGKTMSNQSNISIELIQVITFDHAFWQPRPCKFGFLFSILYDLNESRKSKVDLVYLGTELSFYSCPIGRIMF